MNYSELVQELVGALVILGDIAESDPSPDEVRQVTSEAAAMLRDKLAAHLGSDADLAVRVWRAQGQPDNTLYVDPIAPEPGHATWRKIEDIAAERDSWHRAHMDEAETYASAVLFRPEHEGLKISHGREALGQLAGDVGHYTIARAFELLAGVDTARETE